MANNKNLTKDIFKARLANGLEYFLLMKKLNYLRAIFPFAFQNLKKYNFLTEIWKRLTRPLNIFCLILPKARKDNILPLATR